MASILTVLFLLTEQLNVDADLMQFSCTAFRVSRNGNQPTDKTQLFSKQGCQVQLQNADWPDHKHIQVYPD